jgi:DNA-binding transcriptional LysR family regulator
MEERLGVTLFQRARDGYTPTPAGEAALEVAHRLLGDVADLERRLSGEDLRPSGVVRVTTTDSLLDVLAPTVAAFHAAYPEIQVELVSANAFFTLTKREADAAIRPSVSAPEHLAGRRLMRIATALYAAPAYLEAAPAVTNVAEHAWIGFDDDLAHLGSARWVAANVAPRQVTCRANAIAGLAALARAGLGVAALPCYLGDRDPALRRLTTPMAEMESALWLLIHPDLRRLVRLRAVLDFFAPRLQADRDLFEGKEGTSELVTL